MRAGFPTWLHSGSLERMGRVLACAGIFAAACRCDFSATKTFGTSAPAACGPRGFLAFNSDHLP